MEPWSADGLVLLGALASIRLAQGKTADQLALLSAFFQILGDNLALLSLSAPGEESSFSPPDSPAGPAFVP